MSSIRDKIAQADDTSYEDVEVPEWGVTIRVVSPPLGRRNELLRQLNEVEDGTVDFDSMYVDVLTAACADPETGEPVFGPGDRDLILGKSAEATHRLFLVAQEKCGLKGDAVIDQGKGGSA